MLTLTIILAYIGNVFLNRYMFKIIFKKGVSNSTAYTWFIPIIPTIALIWIGIEELFWDWFTGKHW